MALNVRHKGTVILMTVFAIALLSTLVIGILQLNTEEVQLMQNQVYAAEALAIAEAGLNDAFYELRNDKDWVAGFTDKSFAGGTYTVVVTGTYPTVNLKSTGTSAQGYVAIVELDATIGGSFPYRVRANRRSRR